MEPNPGAIASPKKDVDEVAPIVKSEEPKAATVEDVGDVSDPDEDDLDDLDGKYLSGVRHEFIVINARHRHAR
jgi:peroxin-19